MEDSQPFAPLLIVIFLAFIVPIVLSRFKKLRLPIVVGELIIGIIVGRSGLGWVAHHDPVLDLLSEFGFVFLMFLSGMEIDFSEIGLAGGNKNGGKSPKLGPLPLGITSFAITIALSVVIGLTFSHFGLVKNPWMMALILSTTSLGVVVPVLKEKGLTNSSYGQSILISALIADFATMFLITVLVAALSKGLTLEVLLVFVLFVAFFFMYRFGNFFFNRLAVVRRTFDELSHATAQIKVRAAFTMMLLFVALSEMLGTEVILGAFLGGAIISLLKRAEDEDLEHQLNSIGYGFFIPIFFIMVGVDFNLEALLNSTEALLLAPILILAALVVKYVPSLIYKLSYSWKETLAAGTILSARLSLIIAASAIGLRLGIISEPVNAAIVLVALITVSTAPTIFARIIPSVFDAPNKPFVVVSGGQLGLQVADQLIKHNHEVILIAKNDEQKQRAEQRGINVIIADPTRRNSEAAPYLENARAVVCATSKSNRAYEVCKQARFYYGIDNVIARVDDPKEISKFEEIGVATTNATIDQAALIAMLARNSSMYDLLTRTDDDKDILEILVNKSTLFDQKIRDINLPDEVLIVSLQRDNTHLIPGGDTQLKRGDKISLLGTYHYLEQAKSIFN